MTAYVDVKKSQLFSKELEMRDSKSGRKQESMGLEQMMK